MLRLTPLLAALVAVPPAAAQVRLTEVLASNRAGLSDRDGLHADWVELHNAGPDPVDLAGHYLSDDPQRLDLWRFPSATIAPGGYLVVFASGKDRVFPGRPLHTSFRLAAEGGQVILSAPDGRTGVSRIDYGPQFDDVSLGSIQPFQAEVLLGPRAEGRFALPREEDGREWTRVEFDDSGWSRGPGGFGWQRSVERTLADAIGTDVGDVVRGRASGAYYRFPFEVAAPRAIDLCMLSVRFESGFVAYLNGEEVARRRAPRSPLHDASAQVGIEPRDPRRAELFEVPSPRELLREGTNVLAVHGLVESANSLEHLVQVELTAYTVDQPDPGPLRYFGQPSPGRPNGTDGFAGVAPAPALPPDGDLSSGVRELPAPPAPPGGVVRYTLDGSDPHADSPVFDGPLRLSASVEVRARSFVPGALPSPPVRSFHSRLSDELAGFSSDLPVFLISTGGREVRPKSYVDAHVHLVRPGASGRAGLLDAPEYSGGGAIKMRGSSTLERPKKSYGLELRSNDGHDRRAALLGLPPDSDWVLYGPHNWDQSHLRNALCLELAARAGLDAPRWRFVEVFLNTERRELRASDYLGLYVLIERISQGPHRVDVERIEPAHDREPSISGGYVLKIDRPGPGDMGFSAGGQRLQFVYPKEREITEPQRAWLLRHFQDFSRELRRFANGQPDVDLEAWIELDNWLDYHFFHEYTKNPDAFTLSTYLHKRRNRRIRMGPVWDFDRAMRTNDAEYWVGRPSSPDGWTSDTRSGWWEHLLGDAAVERRWRARARAMLAGELRLERVQALVDAMAAQIEEAEERDRRRWPIIAAGGWYDEILDLQAWIAARDAWLRSEVLETPVLTTSTGGLAPPLVARLSLPDGQDGSLLYTLDGADPALQNGAVSPRARAYEGPIEIRGPTRLRARALVDGVWSRQLDQALLERTRTLRVSELMYNPESGGDYEFLELENYGDLPLALDGVEIDGGMRFHFSTGEVRELAPGQRVVVVRDRHEFADRYDVSTMLLAGEFFGRFSNTDGDLRVTGPLGELLSSARYQDDWYPETDGRGRSLVVVDGVVHALEQQHWTPSEQDGGSPGR